MTEFLNTSVEAFEVALFIFIFSKLLWVSKKRTSNNNLPNFQTWTVTFSHAWFVIVDLSSSCFVGRYTRRALGAHSSTEGDPKTSCTEHQESSSESTTKTSSRDAQETSRRPWKISLWQPHVCYWWWISSIASVHNQLQLEFTGLCNSGWTTFFWSLVFLLTGQQVRHTPP